MAAPPRGTTPPTGKPGNVPPPGSVPKLPQTIFNLEKKGGPGQTGERRPKAK